MQNVFYISTNPLIARFGPLTLDWYGVMVALAVATAIVWLVLANRRDRRIGYNTILIAIVIGLVSGVILSKLLHVADNFPYYRQNPGLILSGDGWAIWGMALGVILGVWVYGRVSARFRFTLLADMLAPGLILAQAVGRVGCTINGCCYGLETTSPFAVIYTNPNSFGPIGIPTLPVTVFEIVFNLIVFGVLLSFRNKLKPEGSLFLIYLALYAAWRFGSDFMRAGTPFLFGLHEAQLIALIVLLITIPLIILKVRWAGKETPVKDSSFVRLPPSL
jgi:phosphatidylglycerol---prolipoprotein diacylglyceryl transferase